MPDKDDRQRHELAREYIIVQLKVMSDMAIQMGHGQLAFLIDMARLEAEDLWSLRRE